MYAYCIVEYPVKSLDKAFTYKIPLNLQEKLKVGMKVLVPFNNRLVHGIVLKITDTYEKTYELKERRGHSDGRKSVFLHNGNFV